MRQRLPLSFYLIIFSIQFSFAQSNCSNPTQVTVCPDTTFANQTNAGMIDDAPASFNVIGEDVVYQINVPSTTTKIYVSVANATGNYRGAFIKNSCSSSPLIVGNFSAGSRNNTFAVSGATTYFYWIDATSTITYDIAFGADTTSVLLNIPNTSGNLSFDSSGCAVPYFFASKPFFNVSFNRVYQTNPMTLAPLGIQGSMCLSTFFKNTTGVESIKQFQFKFDSLGYVNVNAVDSLNGFFTPGQWIKSQTSNTITYNFIDSMHLGIGDFDGSPNSCLNYSFCFNVTPISNDPAKTNVYVSMLSDGKGAGFVGNLVSGCCPAPNPNCHGANGGTIGNSGNAFGFGIADPGSGSLPISLIQFEVIKENKKVMVNWATATEVNNDFFTVERSKDGQDWKVRKVLQGAGNSSTTKTYSYRDDEPLPGISYYRLKQTDFDGKFAYSSIQVIRFDEVLEIKIYPNPASTLLMIEDEFEKNYLFELINQFGQTIHIITNESAELKSINVEEVPNGIYFLNILLNNKIQTRKMISIVH